MTDTRLIERWLPIAALGIESIRERTPMTPFPAPNRLHVWWARRPLVASRAAILASLLPANADRERFLHVLGIHGDPVAAKKRIAIADRKGERLGAGAYGYSRAFGYTPSISDKDWTDVQPMGRREYGLLAPGMTERLRVTTDPEYFEEHAESLELWSPGNPLFNPPEFLAPSGELPPGGTLKDILDD